MDTGRRRHRVRQQRRAKVAAISPSFGDAGAPGEARDVERIRQKERRVVRDRRSAGEVSLALDDDDAIDRRHERKKWRDRSPGGRPIFALVTLVPLIWLLSVTMTAGLESIFNPRINVTEASKYENVSTFNSIMLYKSEYRNPKFENNPTLFELLLVFDKLIQKCFLTQ